MYLEHFGLTEPPFKITPVTDYFFSGANRGEILDALIYSISEAEGIIKISGEVGSGKTMLCRMLLEKLPSHIEPIYLANPSLSREEMLYAIADGLGLNIAGERVGIIMQNIQNKLEQKAREGKRIVVLVDEAHAMPLDTLEELRLLYNLQIGNNKLLQIVLFGQPELNAKLDQPNMRQLKDRIVHHFSMQPLSRHGLSGYLMFRMHTAGYRGQDIFSAEALKLIAKASNGLMRRVNILADKSLLAAFVDDSHTIATRHVQAAMRDSEIALPSAWSGKTKLLAGTTAVLLLAILAASWLLIQNTRTSSSEAAIQASPASDQTEARNTIAAEPPAKLQTSPGMPTAMPVSSPPAASQPVSAVAAAAATSLPVLSLFEQRIAAGKQLLEQPQATASIQLFYKVAADPKRIEGFLQRARALGVLSEIYLLPATVPITANDRQDVRVLYGAYPSPEAATAAIQDLPERYRATFVVSTYLLPRRR